MATNLKVLHQTESLGTKEYLETKIKYLEAKCNRLEHTNIALTSKVQEILLLRELSNAKHK